MIRIYAFYTAVEKWAKDGTQWSFRELSLPVRWQSRYGIVVAKSGPTFGIWWEVTHIRLLSYSQGSIAKTSIWPNVTQLPRNFLAKWVKGPIFQLHWLLSSKSKKRSIFQYLWFRDDTSCLNSRVLVQIFSPFSLQYGNHPPVTLLQQQGMRVQTHLLQRTSYWANRNRILYERGTRPETRLSR